MPVCSTLRKATKAWQEFFKSDTSLDFFFFLCFKRLFHYTKGLPRLWMWFCFTFSFKMYIPHVFSPQFESETTGEKHTILSHPTKHMYTWVCQEMLFEPQIDTQWLLHCRKDIFLHCSKCSFIKMLRYTKHPRKAIFNHPKAYQKTLLIKYWLISFGLFYLFSGMCF